MPETKQLPNKYKQRIALYGNSQYLSRFGYLSLLVDDKYDSNSKDNSLKCTYMVKTLVDLWCKCLSTDISNCLLSCALLISL
jgi:hypothetical protein